MFDIGCIIKRDGALKYYYDKDEACAAFNKCGAYLVASVDPAKVLDFIFTQKPELMEWYMGEIYV